MRKKALAVLLALVMLMSLMPMGALAANSSVPLTLTVSSYSAPFINGSTGEHNVGSYKASKYISRSDVGSDNASGSATARFVGSNATGWTLVIDVVVGNYTATWTTNARITNKDMSNATGSVTFGLSFNTAGGTSTYIHISGAQPLPATKETFTLKYDVNGGTPEIPNQTKDSSAESVTFDVTTTIPTKEGFEFDGWSDNGTKVGKTVTVSKSDNYTKTLTAIWKEKVTPTEWDKLTITKTASSDKVEPGEEITYTITVSNNTGKDLTDVTVSDILPGELENVIATPSKGTYASGVWTIPELANGESATLTITANVAENAENGVISNTATITSAASSDNTELPGGSGDSDKADVTVEVKEPDPVQPAELDSDILNGLFKKSLTVTGTMPAAEAFTVLVKGDKGTVSGTTDEMSATGEAPFKFDANAKLTFDDAGTYTFTVTEQPGSTDGMTYDDTSYTMTVVVAKVENANELKAETSFSNPAKPNDPATQTVTFSNTYEKVTPPTDTYTVTYTDGVENEEVFADQPQTVAAGDPIPAYNGTPTRDGYTFTGWLWYKSSDLNTAIEKPDTMPAYDLKAVAQWTPNTDKSTDFDLNDVGGSGNAAIYKSLSIKKGTLPNSFKAAFEAKISPLTDNAAATMGDEYIGTATVTKASYAKVPFVFEGAVDNYGKLHFTKAGTYAYTVKEIIPAAAKDKVSNVTYDKTAYTLTIVVAAKDDGSLYVQQYYVGTAAPEDGSDTPVVITNDYSKSTGGGGGGGGGGSTDTSKPTLNKGDHFAYVMGYPDGTVRPTGSITRAEVSTILFRLLSDDTRDDYFTTESSFTDVNAGMWFNNSVATLEKAGVIVDTDKGGAFRPNEAITRAELAAMLAQFADAEPVTGVKFSDVPADHWAYDAIAIAAKMGWIVGYPDGTFRPDATITRAEMMTLVNRALERMPSGEDHLLSAETMLTFPDCKPGEWYYIAVQEATNSHTYERAATEKNGNEQWTALRDNRDWTKFEY